MGISLVPGQAPADVQALACRAQDGDKQAQLDLGGLFETGRDLPRNIARATKLYKQASQASGGTIWVYTPPPGGGAGGRVLPIDAGPGQAGLDEAKRRLKSITQLRSFQR